MFWLILTRRKLLAMIGEQFAVGDELCGIGMSIRYNEDILSVWNKSADDAEAKKCVFDGLAKALPLATVAYTTVEYKAHDDALQTAALRRQQQRNGQKKDKQQPSLTKSSPAAFENEAAIVAGIDELVAD